MRTILKQLLLLLIFIVMALPVMPQGRGRVLVLGFDSPQFNEVQDRLLRESLMKEFISLGYAVVPVMEVESLIQEEGINRFRKASPDDMKDFCKRLDADIAVNGRIILSRTKQASSQGSLPYACKINVYIKLKDKWSSDTVFAESYKDLYQLIGALTKEISSKADNLIVK